MICFATHALQKRANKKGLQVYKPVALFLFDILD